VLSCQFDTMFTEPAAPQAEQTRDQPIRVHGQPDIGPATAPVALDVAGDVAGGDPASRAPDGKVTGPFGISSSMHSGMRAPCDLVGKSSMYSG
jgi:hypothetical protein